MGRDSHRRGRPGSDPNPAGRVRKEPQGVPRSIRSYPTFEGLAADRGGGRRELWRTAYLRRLLRVGAFVDFNGSTESELDEDFARLVEEAVERGAAAAAPDEAEPVGAEPGAVDFDAVPLRNVVLRVAECVRAEGRVADEDLVTEFERLTGIDVPAARHELVRGICWQGVPLKYVKFDEDSKQWVAGRSLPAPDRRWHDWSINSLKAYVSGNGNLEVEELASAVFAGRPGKTVRRLVRAVLREARKA